MARWKLICYETLIRIRINSRNWKTRALEPGTRLCAVHLPTRSTWSQSDMHSTSHTTSVISRQFVFIFIVMFVEIWVSYRTRDRPKTVEKSKISATNYMEYPNLIWNTSSWKYIYMFVLSLFRQFRDILKWPTTVSFRIISFRRAE